ncbi:hypothetical protein [Gorillibacterium sp. sgz5001074]|uniref:hypothetical protein n=1 Tax=Gorillibacterium sp. sgz5001074 TaxID=3446695 RepID=UPI003F67187E
MTEIVRFICAILIHASVVMMTYAIFKIWIVQNHKQIAILAVLLGSTNYLVRYQLYSKLFLPATLAVFVIALMLLRRYPIAYSILVSLSGYAVIAFIDEFITYMYMRGLDITLDDLLSSEWLFLTSNVTAFVVCVLIAGIFRWRNWGTSFIVSRFHGKYALRKNNYIWAAALIFGLFSVQLGIQDSLKSYHVIILTIFMIFGIWYTYAENKKVLRDRFPDKYKGKGL